MSILKRFFGSEGASPTPARRVDGSGWLSDEIMGMEDGWLLAGPLTPLNQEWSQRLGGIPCLVCGDIEAGDGATAAIKQTEDSQRAFAVCSQCMASLSPNALHSALVSSER